MYLVCNPKDHELAALDHRTNLFYVSISDMLITLL